MSYQRPAPRHSRSGRWECSAHPPPRITAELINRDRAYVRHKLSNPPARQQLDKLTSREYEIAGLIARGFSNQEIAQCLTLEITSVRRYVSRILDKTGLRDRTQIVITWFQAGMSD
ncbi:response regulator transcription factor [Bifidobacterium sp. W8116]|uniref:Response regulator transcription factor n=1 Tax=Bifidobacterium choladohabitans TaxID=2750947 RepID=A0ABS0R0S0_9BIFI|nr:response regulator transcription factor [Bifidobacterium choladohabitans]